MEIRVQTISCVMKTAFIVVSGAYGDNTEILVVSTDFDKFVKNRVALG